jgi:hypothetical protein
MNTIKCHVRVEGGKLLSAANAHRIKAVSLVPSDRMGNRLSPSIKGGAAVSPIYELRNEPPYFQEWRIVNEAKGYAFREIKHGSGICGHQPSVRALVIATLCCGLFGGRPDIEVRVDDAAPGEKSREQWNEHFRRMDEANKARWAKYTPLAKAA